MTLFMVLSVVQGALIITDKNTGTMERYCYSLQKKRSYHAGFYLHNLILTFLQGAAALLIMKVVNGNWELSAFQGVLTAVVIALISTAFASFICAFSRSDMKANITASGLTAIFSLLGGTFIAVESMPGLFRGLSVISPMRWIIEFVRWI
jgi:ABC-type multidrug transport system permease subunit